jgi:hypothetical protein
MNKAPMRGKTTHAHNQKLNYQSTTEQLPFNDINNSIKVFTKKIMGNQ